MNTEEIDWSKAPKWATGHGLAGLSGSPVWLSQDKYTYVDGRQRGGVFYFDSDEGFGLHEIREVAEKPSPWNGTGLPPVGIECEYCYTSPSEYYRVKIIAHDDDKAVYRWVDGPLALKLGDSDNQPLGAVTYPHPQFRPILTPAQIAAEERERAVDELCAVIVGYYEVPKMSERYLMLSRAIYDAGYRKIDTSQPSPAEISSDIKQANINRLAEKVQALLFTRGGKIGEMVEVKLRELNELVALAKELKQ